MDQHLKSVNWKQCLEHANNNAELAKSLLELMLEEYPSGGIVKDAKA